ncbi:MAG: hypothetical protein KDA89_18435, partial [Planctomycetaceae bacterium]|nr:hypothetical protein [Planctomycetaceae bacterium]
MTQRTSNSALSAEPVPQRILRMLPAFAVLAAYSGFLVTHGRRLWAHDYFRFYPVYVAAICGLLISRTRTAEFPAKRIWRIG